MIGLWAPSWQQSKARVFVASGAGIRSHDALRKKFIALAELHQATCVCCFRWPARCGFSEDHALFARYFWAAFRESLCLRRDGHDCISATARRAFTYMQKAAEPHVAVATELIQLRWIASRRAGFQRGLRRDDAQSEFHLVAT